MQYLLGDIFYRTGNKIITKLFTRTDCLACFFLSYSCNSDNNIPECVDAYRFDDKNVYFESLEI